MAYTCNVKQRDEVEKMGTGCAVLRNAEHDH